MECNGQRRHGRSEHWRSGRMKNQKSSKLNLAGRLEDAEESTQAFVIEREKRRDMWSGGGVEKKELPTRHRNNFSTPASQLRRDNETHIQLA